MELHRTILNKGDNIDGYTIIGLFGQGGYGNVYKVINSKGKKLAMKTECLNAPKKALTHEIKIIKNLHSSYFPKYYADGETNEFIYLVLNILGPSVGDIQRLNNDEITTEFTYNFALQSLSIIEKFHECGYIHRDIKPSNFLLKRDQKNPLNLIDFGISKPYINFENGKLLDPIPSRLKGTRKYASVNSHNCQDLGRCDDLFSWFYCVIEMKIGKLPWQDEAVLEKVKEMKESQVPTIIKPYPELTEIYNYLIQLKFKDKPNYDFIRSIILEQMKKDDYDSESFNWIDFYDKNKKIQKSQEKILNNNNHTKDDHELDNIKKETVDNNNFIVNKTTPKQYQNNQNKIKETSLKKSKSTGKHHKHNKKTGNDKRNENKKSDEKDCLIS